MMENGEEVESEDEIGLEGRDEEWTGGKGFL
jgi:hypothetical protein